jgi:ferric-dicitrate binding protein FerR (iron transport regulator)
MMMQDENKPLTTDRRRLLGAGIGLVALAAVAPVRAQPRPAPIGNIAEVSGEAFAEQGGTRRLLAPRGDVLVGDVLTTGTNTRVVLKLGAATTIKLGAEARLKIERYLAEAGGEFDMQAGHMMFERTGKPASQGITFKSAYGLIAVRGTRFYAGPNRGAFALLVGEGRVEVTAAGRSVMVLPQQGIDIKAPGQPPTTPAAWKVPRIREMQANFR